MPGNSCFRASSPLLGAQAPAQKISIFSFCVSLLSPTSFQGAEPIPLGAWGLQLLPRGCLHPYLDEFLMYLGGD